MSGGQVLGEDQGRLHGLLRELQDVARVLRGHGDLRAGPDGDDGRRQRGIMPADMALLDRVPPQTVKIGR